VIERMPDQISVEAHAVDVHVAADMAKPPRHHFRRDAFQQVMADMHHHAAELVIAELDLRTRKRLQRPGQFARRQ